MAEKPSFLLGTAKFFIPAPTQISIREPGCRKKTIGGGSAPVSFFLSFPPISLGLAKNRHGHDKRPGLVSLLGLLSWTEEGVDKEASQGRYSISLTFHVTWMLCEVTGCKVTSMGGPSGAGRWEEECCESSVRRRESYVLTLFLLRWRERKCPSIGVEDFCLSLPETITGFTFSSLFSMIF